VVGLDLGLFCELRLHRRFRLSLLLLGAMRLRELLGRDHRLLRLSGRRPDSWRRIQFLSFL
jgi:hypothetical protein